MTPKAVLICLLTAEVCAAQVGCAVVATTNLVATASGAAPSIFVAGPIPATGLVLQAGSIGTTAEVDVLPFGSGLPPGAIGWTVGEYLGLATGWGTVTAQCSGRVRISFTAGQATRGLLFLAPVQVHSGLTSLTGDVAVDLDCDGVPERFARTSGAIEVPITIDAMGAALCFELSMGGAITNPNLTLMSGYANVLWEVIFIPDTYALELYATGCARTRVVRTATTGWAPSISTGPGQAFAVGFFLIGLGEQNVTLSLPPHCPLLVMNPAVIVPTASSPHGMEWSLPHWNIPLGIRFRCQGIFLDTSGGVITSDAVRSL